MSERGATVDSEHEPRPMFEPDGWVYRARVGLLVPDSDVGPESEWSAIVPAGVSAYASRFRFPVGMVAKVGDRIANTAVEFVAAPGPLDDATALLADTGVDIIALAFISTSYVGGEGDDAKLVERLGKLTNGKPVVTTGRAVLDALRQLGADRVMLVGPPWFPPDLTALGRAWLERSGFAVSHAAPAGLPSGQGNIHPGGLYQWVRSTVTSDTEAVVVAGNGFRAVGVVRALETDIGIPVITANTALLWQALRALGLPTGEVTRYGRLFAEAGSQGASEDPIGVHRGDG